MLGHYLLAALRNFKRAPFSTAANIVALALGLTCFVTAYAVVAYWQSADRHFADHDRISVATADISLRSGSFKTGVVPMMPPVAAQYIRADFPQLEAVARLMPMRNVLIAAGPERGKFTVGYADPALLAIFDLPFAKGDGREALARPASVILSEEAAHRLFGNENPVGRQVRLANRREATVTGVLGRFQEPSHIGTTAGHPVRFDMLASWDLAPPDDAPENWLGGYNATTYVLLPADGTLTAAAFARQMRDFAPRHMPAPQAAVLAVTFGAMPLSQLGATPLDYILFQGGLGLSVYTLLPLLGGLILLVFCLNYANLATAQAIGQTRETGMRKVMGATRGQIMLQYLIQAGCLVFVALLLAIAAIEALAPLVKAAGYIDFSIGLFHGAGIWIFLLALLLAVTVMAGAYPAFILSRLRPIQALGQGRSAAGARTAPVWLVGLQFAAASVLLIGVIVIFQQNSMLKDTGLGIGTDPVLVIRNPVGITGVPSQRLEAALRNLPMVRAVSGTDAAPWSNDNSTFLVSRSPRAGAFEATVWNNLVGYDYFRTVGMTLLAGRAFDRAHADAAPTDIGAADAGRPLHIVIDRALSAQLGFASPQAAVGETIYFPQGMMQAFGKPAQPLTIIGVVENEPLRFYGAGTALSLYQLDETPPIALVRLPRDNVAATLAAIDDMWQRLSPDVPLDASFMDQLFEQSYRTFGLIGQVITGLVAWASVGLQSWRAARAKPAGVLRHE